MTDWQARVSEAQGPLYRRIALAVQEDIAAGRLRPGATLPTHRELARALGITVVTASRAYREAAAWGLVHGMPGLGTFVTRTAGAAGGRRPAAPSAPQAIELNANYVLGAAERRGPSPEGSRLLWEGLAERYPAGGGDLHRAAASTWLRRRGWTPDPEQVVVTAGAQHAIFVALAALARAGDPLYMEALTYPGVKAAARSLGLVLRPVAIDEQGLVPSSLVEQCGTRAGGLLFCQPSLHNPTTAVMPAGRREELAALARERDLTVIEDCVYEFLLLDAPPPLAALAPERTLHIVSGAKTFLRGLRVGYLTAPEPLLPRLQEEVFATCLAAAPSLVDLATGWLLGGAAQRSVSAKRHEVDRRQQLARDVLGEPACEGTHPSSCHLWLRLPPPWRADAFVELAARRGVAVNPAAAFAVDPVAVPAAVRVCLGAASDRNQLSAGLAILADLLAAPAPPEEPVV
jgi:DNA-binding transcriptional MocR family regulator